MPIVSRRTALRGDTWQDASRLIGSALGVDAEADAAVRDVEARVAAARTQTPAFTGRTITSGTVMGTRLLTSLPGDSAVALLTQLGFRLAPQVAGLPPEGTTARTVVADERLDLIDSDVVVLCYPDDGVRRAFEARPLCAQLPAVTRGRYVALPFDVAVALAFPSLLSIPYGLDRTVSALRGAVRA